MNNAKNQQPAFALRAVACLQIALQTGLTLLPLSLPAARAAALPAGDTPSSQEIASRINAFGQMATTGNMAGLAAQQASGQASQQLQQWLETVGTARVTLDTDAHFTPRSGAVDLLLPLYKSQEHLFFTQTGFRQLDGQLTGNLGLGMRHFYDQWMLGYNAFYDQNLSRGHKRVGAGVEAWRDYMKLSGNGYWRVSGWRSTGDGDDYDARPAQGFDLRAEAWLPAWPALGGRMMYEKYYGNDVALFGKDKRQRNPDAITAGLSWTPVPLVSFTADHKRGGSVDETAFGLQLTWQLGQPFFAQLDPARVGERRTLAGSATDLVERNNTIVLEYRKQEVIDLALPAAVTGDGGVIVPLIPRVNARHGVANISWNDADVVAAGGKVIDQGGGHYQLRLPPYLSGGANSYTLSAVAQDTRGNVSKMATTRIVVTSATQGEEKSDLVSSVDTLVANGHAAAILTLTLKDGNDNPVSGRAVTFTSDLTGSQFGAVTDNGDGSYTAAFTGTKVGVATLGAQLAGKPLALPAAPTIALTGDSSTARIAQTTLPADKTTLLANNSEKVTYTLTVKDANDNILANEKVNWSVDLPATRLSASSSSTNASGNAVVTLTGMRAGAATVKATLANGASASAKAVTLTVPLVQFTNGMQLSAALLSGVLNNTEHAVIDSYDSHWTGKIILPDAAAYKNRRLTIKRHSTYNTEVTANGVTEAMPNGTTWVYTSNGSRWVK